MIFESIDIIRQELKNNAINADVGNISEIVNDPNNNGINADVIISLINIEENRISRDPNNFIRKDSGIILKNPAIHLYLTLLFNRFNLVNAPPVICAKPCIVIFLSLINSIIGWT